MEGERERGNEKTYREKYMQRKKMYIKEKKASKKNEVREETEKK